MPDIVQSLQGKDLGHLRIVAELWGIELKAPDARIGLMRLSSSLLDRELLSEVVDGLPEGAQTALMELKKQGGRIPWVLFTRRYGSLREMGAAKRDREKPYLERTANATEALWYRALIGRAFFDTPIGPQEFAYIPDDLIPLLPNPSGTSEITPLGRPATPAEKVFVLPAGDAILDDACTLLAGLRTGIPLAKIGEFFISNRLAPYPLTVDHLVKLLQSAGLIAGDGSPSLEASKIFLESSRAEALVHLVRSWLGSGDFNELWMTPGLVAEGEWRNDPILTRRRVLDFMATIPGALIRGLDESNRPFWSLSSFVAAIRREFPDFQRQAGDYDSWFIRDIKTGEYLRGFEHWDDVEGALLRFIITGPLHWLGITDLGFPSAPSENRLPPPTAIRFSLWAADLLNLSPPQGLIEERSRIHIASDAILHVPVHVPRATRYQLARFMEWLGYSREAYLYKITPKSLEIARFQGLKTHHLLSLLNRNVQHIPPNLVSAMERWETNGSEAFLDRSIILRVNNPEVILALRKTRAARYLGETLNPTAVIVRPEALEKVISALLEIGYLSEVRFDDSARIEKAPE